MITRHRRDRRAFQAANDQYSGLRDMRDLHALHYREERDAIGMIGATIAWALFVALSLAVAVLFTNELLGVTPAEVMACLR